MRGIEGGVERLGLRPVVQRSGSFELDRHQLIAAYLVSINRRMAGFRRASR